MNAWDRLETESTREYSYFQEYLNLGTDRTAVAVAKKTGKSEAWTSKLMEKNNWRDRAAAWDDHVSQIALKKQAEKDAETLITLRKNEIALGSLMINSSRDILQAMKPAESSYTEAARMAEIGSTMIRRAIGEPTTTTRQEVTIESDQRDALSIIAAIRSRRSGAVPQTGTSDQSASAETS